MLKYGVIHWNYRLLLPITFQLLRYLPFERTVFYPPHNRLSRNYTDKNTDALSFYIGSSDCKTSRLVSLTGDGYSVVNDLSRRRDLFGMYWRLIIICLSLTLSMAAKYSNLKILKQNYNNKQGIRLKPATLNYGISLLLLDCFNSFPAFPITPSVTYSDPRIPSHHP